MKEIQKRESSKEDYRRIKKEYTKMYDKKEEVYKRFEEMEQEVWKIANREREKKKKSKDRIIEMVE